MTDIQIKYWSYVEGARHNLATESQQRNELSETGRHNLTTESQGQQIIGENIRHNMTTESQGQQSINENIRHNKVNENIGYINASASMIQANAATRNAQSNAQNANTNAIVGLSVVKNNISKTIGQNLKNKIDAAGIDIKAGLSVIDAGANTANTLVDTGSKFSKSIFGAAGSILKGGM